MKKLFAFLSIALIAGCSTYRTAEDSPRYLPAVKPEPLIGKLKGWDGATVMSDNEVLQSSKQCMYAKLIPNVEYTAVRLDTGGKTLVPIAVHCEHE
jgi:hypothetical protein